jgi:glycosyltransferase involved in cell wall biosynthesis
MAIISYTFNTNIWFVTILIYSNITVLKLVNPEIQQFDNSILSLQLMEPKFTIILPTYNRAHLISTAIESVIAQSVTDWELIVIDDGSTDNTKDVVFSFHDSRIMYGHQENKGRSIARNAGLQNARGTWICFLDSDDWYLEDHLEAFSKAMKEHPQAEMFKTGVTFQKEDGSILSESNFYSSNEGQIPFILSNYACVLDLCIHHTLAKSSGFPDVNSWEDKAYMISILYRAPWIQIELRTVVALEHGGRSILHNYKDVASINKTLDIMEKYLANATYRDLFLGPVQQGYLLSIMVNANEVGVGYQDLKKVLKDIKKNVLPMTWIRYWKFVLLG